MSTFCKSGYLLEKNYFNQNEIDLWKTGVSYFQDIPEIAGGPMKYFEKSQINGDVILNRVENFCDYLPLVKDLINGDKIQTLLQELTGRTYVLFKDKINFKLSGGGGFRPHQDGAAFRKFINDELITVMIPVHSSNEENGSLRIKPHSYKKELYQHNNGTINEFDHSDEHDTDWKSIHMEPGDILCFSSYLVHQSNDNRMCNIESDICNLVSDSLGFIVYTVLIL